MTTPRIDTVRREIADTKALLTFLADNLEDLHGLAYERSRAAQDVKVRGGQRDYALDTHGDPKARDLYARAAKQLLDLIHGHRIHRPGLDPVEIPGIAQLIAEVRGFLTAGPVGGTNSTATVSADDVIAQIAARRRRAARGEYEPHPIAQQPTVLPSIDWQTEAETLRAAVRKVTTEFMQDHQHCQPPDEGAGRYKRKLLRRYPTKNLSTREREAWRTAVQSVAAAPTAEAS